MTEPRAPAEALRARYWRRVSQLTAGLLAVWLLVSVGAPWFARDLNRWQVGGFSLGFWINAQGAILVFVALIAIYAWVMDRLDHSFLEASSMTEPRQGRDSEPRA